MLTICLDEFGYFEVESNDKLKFVGGAVYIGTDYEEEKNRITEFLREECKKAGGQFPYDLHRNHENTNYRLVTRVKQNIASNLQDYLKRSGKYHITCILSSKKERQDYIGLSNLVDNKVASNLYEHMITGVLMNLLFHNIDLDEYHEVNLEIPTRLAVIPIEDDRKIKQFERLGYKSRKIPSSGKEYDIGFYCTDEKTFKTALSSAIVTNRSTRRLFFNNINVQSINYSYVDNTASMAFLYLADFLCSNISYNVNMHKDDYGIEELHKWAKEVTGGNEPFFWAYDDIESVNKSILNNYYNKDFIEMICELHNAEDFKSNYYDYYRNHWFSLIERNSEKAYEINNTDQYISKIDSMLRNDFIDVKMVVAAFDQQWAMMNKNKDSIHPKVFYRAADAGIRIYNHKGDIVKTNGFFKICCEFKDSVDTQEYLDTVNRVAVIDADMFDFEEALNKVRFNLECFDILKRAKSDVAELNDSCSVVSTKLTGRGRALSSIGQYLAFQKDESAYEYFEKAFEEFEEDSSNRSITVSYLLHHAIDAGKLVEYEKYAVEYFGGNIELEQQLDYVLQRKSSFMMYVFVKSLNNLYFDKLGYKLLSTMRTVDYKNIGFDIHSHPWELINKNLGILLYKKGYMKLASRAMEDSMNCIKDRRTTINAINCFTRIQQGFYEDNPKLLKKSIDEFRSWLDKEDRVKPYFIAEFTDSYKETYENLSKKFTYMYI